METSTERAGWVKHTVWLARFVFVLILGSSSAIAQQQDLAKDLRRVLDLEDKAPLPLIRGLGRSATAEALAAVSKAIAVLDKGDRLAAAYQSLAPFAANKKLAPQAAEILVAEARRRPPGIARNAIKSLAPFADCAERDLLDLAQRHADERCRAIALRPLLPALSARGDRSGLRLILSTCQLRHSGRSEQIIAALAGFPLGKLAKEVRNALRDPDLSPTRKWMLLRAMSQHPAVKLEGVALLALDDEDATVVAAALQTLAAWRSDRHAKHLARLSRHDASAVRLLARREQLRLGIGPDARTMAQSRDPVARQAAAMALRPGGEEDPLLRQLLVDEVAAVRDQCIASLVARRSSAALELLVELFPAARGVTAQHWLDALEELSGEAFGPNPAVWQQWWQDHRQQPLPSAEEVAQRRDQRAEQRARDHTAAGFWGLPVVGERIAFVLDTSDSMKAAYRASSRYGGTGNRLSAAKAQLIGALKDLPDTTWFRLYFFDRKGWTWRDTATRADAKGRAEAVTFVQALETRLGTALYDALELAFADPKIEAIYLLSDGAPYLGKIDDPERIRTEVAFWNATRRIPIHCISLAGKVPLLQQLAADSGGRFRQVR